MSERPTPEDPPGLDLARLRDHLDAYLPGLVAGPLSGELIQGGRSNLTYVVRDGQQEWIVRRPPLGHVLATAHDMAREYRVMAALADTVVPVPRTHLLCDDDDVLGAPFYVMEFVRGTVYRSPHQIEPLTGSQRTDLAQQLMDVLADLHSIVPEDVGLGDFGRPEGFLTRQVRRWGKQLEASRSRDLDGIDQLAEQLAATTPDSPQATIVHGDYRLDNVIVGAGYRIDAVLDWEMATLGDPLTDLGLLVAYWEGFQDIADNPITKGVGPAFGFPAASDLLARYAERSGRDLSSLDWYLGFAYFKLAVILEGIHFRFQQGKTVGTDFEKVGALVPPLVGKGLTALKEA